MVQFEATVTVHEVEQLEEIDPVMLSVACTKASHCEALPCLQDEDTTDAGSSSSDADASESAMSGAEEKMMNQRHSKAALRLSTRCRFHKTQLETIPGTPVATQGLPSPPGLSRTVMRRARDLCTALPTATPERQEAKKPGSEGIQLSTTPQAPRDAAAAVFTRGPSGNPLTPPCKSKKRRAMRDAVKPQWSFAASPAAEQRDGPAARGGVGLVSTQPSRLPLSSFTGVPR
mmetsp:Transcript_13516/g.30726  ORF Transcript_13516/g.30726 Transcript_13516/m.30726 type:complete len:231 (-) Transcript_13516:128-820(-)